LPVYEYKALDQKGKTVSGIVDADSAAAARGKLRQRQVYPVALQAVRSPSAAREGRLGRRLHLGGVSLAELSMMLRQLATLVEAGFQLVQSFETLIPQTRSAALKRCLAQVKNDIVAGSSLSSAMERYSGIFSSLVINMVKAGERSGTLGLALDRLADITERQMLLRNRIRAAMVYPILMTVIGTVVLIFLMTYVVPSITKIFDDMQQTLPAPTRMLIAASEVVKSYWWVAALLMIAGWIAFMLFRRTRTGRDVIDRTKLRLPLVGLIVRMTAAARFGRTLGSLLENGVPLIAALEVSCNVAGNVRIGQAVSAAAVSVEQGQGLGKALADRDALPPLAIQMIEVGEKSGALEQMLGKLAEVYEKEMEARLMGLTALIEPLMIVFMGVVIGFIVLSICLPIFDMNQLVK